MTGLASQTPVYSILLCRYLRPVEFDIRDSEAIVSVIVDHFSMHSSVEHHLVYVCVCRCVCVGDVWECMWCVVCGYVCVGVVCACVVVGVCGRDVWECMWYVVCGYVCVCVCACVGMWCVGRCVTTMRKRASLLALNLI